MSEEAASFAVLGVDIESLGAAVARHWGLGDEVLHMIRRLPVDKPVRTPDSDADMLRVVGQRRQRGGRRDDAAAGRRASAPALAQRGAALRAGAASSARATCRRRCRARAAALQTAAPPRPRCRAAPTPRRRRRGDRRHDRVARRLTRTG